MGSQGWKNSYTKRLSRPWSKLLFPKVCRVKQWQQNHLDVIPHPLSAVLRQHLHQWSPFRGLLYLPHRLRALHLQRLAIKEQKIARSLWKKREKKASLAFAKINSLILLMRDQSLRVCHGRYLGNIAPHYSMLSSGAPVRWPSTK